MKEILDALKDWCDRENGQPSVVAKVIGVSPGAVTSWLSGEQQPTSEQILLLQEFLAKQKNYEKSE
ncbi:MAG: helix-turn-helix transcriptional regulator [Verrucomicrobia bacterium]|nr:helix-turn-helix transcriptional regulator [Verrucomicrobiota bacterium]MBV8375549.1 helix-turn-helix transcriptional regulator [Verrucomicrobiota bacterium]